MAGVATARGSVSNQWARRAKAHRLYFTSSSHAFPPPFLAIHPGGEGGRGKGRPGPKGVGMDTRHTHPVHGGKKDKGSARAREGGANTRVGGLCELQHLERAISTTHSVRAPIAKNARKEALGVSLLARCFLGVVLFLLCCFMVYVHPRA